MIFYHKVCLMVFKTIFNNISVKYHGGQFYWWRKPEEQEKTTDLSQDTDKLYHTSPWSRFELTISVMTGTDCTGNLTTIRSWPRRPLIVRFIFKYYNNHFERTWWRLRTKSNINVCFCFIDFFLYKSYRVLICIFTNF
jgi:hypothetical protein